MSVAQAKAKPKSKQPHQARRGAPVADASGVSHARPMSSAAQGVMVAAGPAFALGAPVQAQLTVGHPNDPYEQEADAVANQVSGGFPAPSISRLTPGALSGTAQRQMAEDEEPIQRQMTAEEEPIQRQMAAEEEEPVQRQMTPEEEEPVQRAMAVEEEEPVQREVAQEEEEPVQRQMMEGDEPIQRQIEEEPIQRLANGAPRISPTTAATIRNPGAGQPIPRNVRQRIEPHVGADLSGARVHASASASQATSSLGARAFTHRNHIFLGARESPNNVRLMAHEATHVVQQGAAPVQRKPDISSTPHDVQRLPAFIAEELDEYARYVPGYTLFTVIIGYNPLLGTDVARTPINLLEGLMGLVPFGTVIFDKLNELGIIQDAFAWVQGELDRFDLSLSRIERTIEEAYEEMDFVRLDPFDYNLGVLKRHFGGLYNDVIGFAESLVGHIIDMIKEAAIGVAEGLLAENKAWDLIKKVIHYDPLRGESVEASTVEILEDFLLLIGKEQEVAQMKEKGTLQETADWLDTQIVIFLGLLVQLSQLFSAAWEAIQPENLPNLMANLQSLAGQVFGFLQQVWDFASTVALKVLELIKNSLLSWLSDFAHEVPGFHLITVIIGSNPFTNEPVPPTPENIIRGFITLLPGGNAIYAQLAETGTIAQTAARIEGAMASLGISWEFITGLFLGIWDNLSIEDLIDPIGAFTRIRDQFGEPISRLFSFISVVLREMFMLILQLMNFPTDLIGSIIGHVVQAIEDIKNDPVGFLLNLLAAVKQGFANFFSNILTHLIGGLAAWLFRGLRDAGIEPPADLSLQSVLDFVLQVLGISMERIWQKLADRIGQETVDRIRGAIDRLVGIWTFVRDVQERGVAAIWEYIESQISSLWDMVLAKAQEWIMERIINRAIQWLLSLLDPTGIMPVINSFIAFFKAVQSAIEYLRDILAIINDYVSTVAAIARGAIEPGAQKLEQGLANAIPIAIGFLANQFGLGNIGEKIQEIVGGIRELVDQALDWLIDRAVSMVQSLLSALGFGGEEEVEGAEEAEIEPPMQEAVSEPDLDSWWLEHHPFADPTGKSHTLLFHGMEENAALVVRSDEQMVSDWLVARREAVSEPLRPLVDDALQAYSRFTLTKNNLEALRVEFEQLPEQEQEARRAEYTTVYLTFRAALRELGRTFSAIPIEAEPDEIVLRLPAQKSSALYRGHLGRLQHSKQRPARDTDQLQRWEQHVRSEIIHEWWDYGQRLGLTEAQILRPDWDKRGTRMPMQVDHKIEWQVRPIGDETTLDEPWNYELLDAASNQASGAAINTSIEEERSRIAQDTGDQSWLNRDITFTKVEGGGTAGRRWDMEEITTGLHLQVYARKYGEPPASETLPSAEAAQEAQPGGAGAAEATERRAALESTIRSLGAQYPQDAGNIRTLVELRLASRSWDEIRKTLGVRQAEFTWLRDVVARAGIHV